jgi:hypothetical protein
MRQLFQLDLRSVGRVGLFKAKGDLLACLDLVLRSLREPVSLLVRFVERAQTALSFQFAQAGDFVHRKFQSLVAQTYRRLGQPANWFPVILSS